MQIIFVRPNFYQFFFFYYTNEYISWIDRFSVKYDRHSNTFQKKKKASTQNHRQ